MAKGFVFEGVALSLHSIDQSSVRERGLPRVTRVSDKGSVDADQGVIQSRFKSLG